MPNIIRRYINRMKFAVYMTFSFLTFFHVSMVSFFLSLYIWLYVLYTFVWFCKLCILLLFLCIFIMFMNSFLLCMFRYVYSVSLCCSVYCLCVNVYCTVQLPPGVDPIVVNKIYIYIYHNPNKTNQCHYPCNQNQQIDTSSGTRGILLNLMWFWPCIVVNMWK